MGKKRRNIGMLRMEAAHTVRMSSKLNMFMGELCSLTHCSLADILVLADGTILPAPVMPSSTRILARLKCVQKHSLPVNTHDNV